jgi:hypothetical protein
VSKKTHHNGNIEDIKLVSHAITTLPPENVQLSVREPPISSTCRNKKIQIHKIKHRGSQNWIQMGKYSYLKSVDGEEFLYYPILYTR